MRKVCQIITAAAVALTLLAACGAQTEESTEAVTEGAGSVLVGFSQLGAESDWRSANSESMRSSLSKENGYTLLFEDGQQKQSRQITAIRSFIQQDVDYIVLAPVTQTGWDSVLSEARKAEIPVIIVDRMVAVDDPELFTCWVGSDFLTEGRKACEWLHEFTEANEISPEDIHIVNIQGTLDSSAQLGRTRGLEEAARAYGWDLREQAPGDFTQAKGREGMARMLKTYNNINVVYCENDNEALGAIEAIEAAGQKCGSDIMNGEIMVISFDGINENAIQYCLDGTISLIVECNPLHGPRVEAILQSLEKGETPEKYEYVYETLYSSCRDVESVTVEEETYPVTILTQEVIDARPY